ncbi:unnamed protein product [Urochloa humidicola]
MLSGITPDIDVFAKSSMFSPTKLPMSWGMLPEILLQSDKKRYLRVADRFATGPGSRPPKLLSLRHNPRESVYRELQARESCQIREGRRYASGEPVVGKAEIFHPRELAADVCRNASM